MPSSLDQAVLFMIIVSMAIGYPVFESRYGGKSISLTDIITILYAPWIVYRLVRARKQLILINIYGPLILLISFLISILIHVPADGIRSLFGWMRPTWLYITVLTLLSEDYERQTKVIYDAFVCALFLTLCTGFVAILSYLFFDLNSTGILIRAYYFGLWPVQLAGLDGHPNGAAQFIMISTAIIWFLNKRSPRTWFLFFAFTGLIATLSKSILIYGAIGMGYFKRIKPTIVFSRITIPVSILCISGYLFFSHFYPVPANKKDLNDLHSFIIESKPVFQFGTYSFYETIYSANKIAAIRAFMSAPLAGIGPRNYIPFVQHLKLEGKYPDNNQFLNPHCTYTSVAARFGLIGLIGLIICMTNIFKSIKQIGNNQLRILFGTVYFIFTLDAITSDMEYARMFWFFNAWLSAPLFCQSSFTGNQEQQTTQ
jgi:O-Antigen ligase